MCGRQWMEDMMVITNKNYTMWMKSVIVYRGGWFICSDLIIIMYWNVGWAVLSLLLLNFKTFVVEDVC